MRYHEFIRAYLRSSGESVGQFARRAGVNRSTVYRARSGDGHLLFHLVEKMVSAAGGSLGVADVPVPQGHRCVSCADGLAYDASQPQPVQGAGRSGMPCRDREGPAWGGKASAGPSCRALAVLSRGSLLWRRSGAWRRGIRGRWKARQLLGPTGKGGCHHGR